MHHLRSALLLLSSIGYVGCAGNRAHSEPVEPSDLNTADVTVAQNGGGESQLHTAHSDHPEQGAYDDTRPAPEPGLPNTQPQLSVRPNSEDQARAAFTSANGYDLRGQAEFIEVARGVEVRVAVNGAPPGIKGVHIHQQADCSDIANKSMGGHFSPEKQGHGYPTTAEHHLGDLGNIQIGADGAGELKIVVPAANLKDADAHSFLTRSIVVHEASDTGTGEAGAAGQPIACGIIDR